MTKRGPYSADPLWEVQQRPLTCASKHNQRHTRLAGTTTKRPALPLVLDQEAVPAACPIDRSTPELTVTPGQPDTPAHLRTGRPTRCANRPLSSGSRVRILPGAPASQVRAF